MMIRLRQKQAPGLKGTSATWHREESLPLFGFTVANLLRRTLQGGHTHSHRVVPGSLC